MKTPDFLVLAFWWLVASIIATPFLGWMLGALGTNPSRRRVWRRKERR